MFSSWVTFTSIDSNFHHFPFFSICSILIAMEHMELAAGLGQVANLYCRFRYRSKGPFQDPWASLPPRRSSLEPLQFPKAGGTLFSQPLFHGARIYRQVLYQRKETKTIRTEHMPTKNIPKTYTNKKYTQKMIHQQKIYKKNTYTNKQNTKQK